MAEVYGFFDSISSDRAKDSSFWDELLLSIINDGIILDMLNDLEPTANSSGNNMLLDVDTGTAFIQGKYYNNDASKSIDLTEETTPGTDRIDRIVVKVDYTARTIAAVAKEGTPAASPTAPTLQQDASVFEYSIAQVYITGGNTYISTSDITDERGTSFFPYVTSQILPPGTDTDALVVATDVSEDPDTVITPFILTSHANAPDSDGNPWFVRTYFVDTISSIADTFQLAYGSDEKLVYFRCKTSEVLSDWVKITTSDELDDRTLGKLTTGTSTAYVSGLLDYDLVQGASFIIRPHTANTGSATMSINALAYIIYKSVDGAKTVLDADDLLPFGIYQLTYWDDGGTPFFLLASSSGGSVTVQQVLESMTLASQLQDIDQVNIDKTYIINNGFEVSAAIDLVGTADKLNVLVTFDDNDTLEFEQLDPSATPRICKAQIVTDTGLKKVTHDRRLVLPTTSTSFSIIISDIDSDLSKITFLYDYLVTSTLPIDEPSDYMLTAHIDDSIPGSIRVWFLRDGNTSCGFDFAIQIIEHR